MSYQIQRILMNHFDPSVRLALAENPDAPEEILEELLSDSEPDVAAAAQETLEENEDDFDDDE